METRPSRKSFHYILTSKNINFIINNDDVVKNDSKLKQNKTKI